MAISESIRMNSAVFAYPQNRHAPRPLRTLASRGDTSRRHVRQRDRHGVSTLVYGSTGSTPAARISAAATSGTVLRASPLRTAPQWRHPPRPLRTLSNRGETSLPQVRHRDFHGALAFVYGSSGSTPPARISATAVSVSARCASPRRTAPQWRHPLLPLRTVLSRGDTSRPQSEQRDRHGVSMFVYGSNGSTPAARISATAVSASTRCASPLRRAAQKWHALRPWRTLLSLGETSRSQVRQRHSHGVCAPRYGASGSTPAARISAIAIAGSPRRFSSRRRSAQ